MSVLLLFLLLSCSLSVLSSASRSSALWPRLILLPLLFLVYGLNLIGWTSASAVTLLIAGSMFAAGLLRWGQCSRSQLVGVIGPLAVAGLLVLWIGLRPALLEYPADNVSYWYRLIGVSGIESADGRTCEMGGLASYVAYCTLWFKLAAATTVPQAWLVSGVYAKAVHCGELLLLALTLIRFWVFEKIRPLAATCMLVLAFLGTGYLYDAFVINHAMQGSLLAAALLVESASVYCWLFARLRRSGEPAQLVGCAVGWYGLGFLYLAVMIKLHGLFALLLLIWLLIVPVLLTCLPPRLVAVRRSSVCAFALVAVLLTACLFAVKQAAVLPIPPNFAGVVIRWSDALGIPGFGDWGPASFVPRTSDTRPEALAVLSLLAAVLILVLLAGERLRAPVQWPVDFALLTSLYVISVLVAYVIPPFSNLFLKLDPDYSAHMRLMWGACLLSPLPVLLFLPAAHFRRSILALSCLAISVILVPVQFRPGQRAQLFFSKTRHFVVPTPVWADPAEVARRLMPHLVTAAGSGQQLQRTNVAADPLIRAALGSFGVVYSPQTDIGFERIYSFQQISQSAPFFELQLSSGDESAPAIMALPGLVIQQAPRECFYSVYADMQAYEPCVAAGVTRLSINRLPAALLRRFGYELVWQSDADGYKIWRRVPV